MFVNEIFSSGFSKIVLFWVIALFSATLLIILGYAVFYRLRNNRIDSEMTRFHPVLRELIYGVQKGLVSEERIKETLQWKDYKYFERYLRGSIGSIAEYNVSAEKRIADVSGFSDYLRNKAVSSKGWKQAQSLRTLSYFRSKDNKEIFENVMKKSRFAPALLAAGLGLALCDSYDSMGDVFKKIYESTECNEDVLLMIISAYGAGSAEYLHELLRSQQTSISESCIMADALGIFRYRAARETLRNLLFKTPSIELSQHIMDALKFVGDAPLADELVPFLKHQNYFIRVKAAFTISALGGAAYIPPIEELLNDRIWWVRRNAAEAILNTGRQGLERLQDLAKSRDEAPRSAAQMILTDYEFNKLGVTVNE